MKSPSGRHKDQQSKRKIEEWSDLEKRNLFIINTGSKTCNFSQRRDKNPGDFPEGRTLESCAPHTGILFPSCFFFSKVRQG